MSVSVSIQTTTWKLYILYRKEKKRKCRLEPLLSNALSCETTCTLLNSSTSKLPFLLPPPLLLLLLLSSLLPNIRNPSQPKPPLTQLRPSRLRHIKIPRIQFPITIQRHMSHMSRIRPMCRSLTIFKRLLLPLQILLRDITHWHIAGIHGEAGLGGARRTEIIVRSSRVPDYEIAGFHADFFPFEAFVCEPLHAFGGETVPFFGPVGLGGIYVVSRWRRRSSNKGQI